MIMKDNWTVITFNRDLKIASRQIESPTFMGFKLNYVKTTIQK
jgi:hypothetical protein